MNQSLLLGTTVLHNTGLVTGLVNMPTQLPVSIKAAEWLAP